MVEPVTRGELELLLAEGRDLTREVRGLASKLKQSRLVVWALSVIAVLMVAGLVAISLVAVRTAHNFSCIRDWADKTNARTTFLTPLSNARADAQYVLTRANSKVIVDAFAPVPDIALIKADGRAVIDASINYDKAAKSFTDALAAHPVPPAPQYACGTF